MQHGIRDILALLSMFDPAEYHAEVSKVLKEFDDLASYSIYIGEIDGQNIERARELMLTAIVVHLIQLFNIDADDRDSVTTLYAALLGQRGLAPPPSHTN